MCYHMKGLEEHNFINILILNEFCEDKKHLSGIEKIAHDFKENCDLLKKILEDFGITYTKELIHQNETEEVIKKEIKAKIEKILTMWDNYNDPLKVQMNNFHHYLSK
uniref:Uncharacterized protein n=1 Tax=Meloidogyne hapla TaxID=6305 RepID=A0A1I8B8D1_MELHA